MTLNLESEGEATRALVAAERLGVTPRLAVRVNPEIELRGSGMRMGRQGIALRGGCRPGRGVGEAGHRGGRRLAGVPHICRFAGA